MLTRPHYLFNLILGAVGLCSIAGLSWYAGRRRRLVQAGLAAAAIMSAVSVLFGTIRVASKFPAEVVTWVGCLGLFTVVSAPYALLLTMLYRMQARHNPARRQALRLITEAAVATPAALATFGIVRRNELQFREVDIRVPASFQGLNGLRIVQLTDIHLSALVPDWLLESAVGMANDARPHLAIVTGDLISTRGDPLDRCMDYVSRLKADAGILGCNGNHEIYARAERYVTERGARMGIDILRNESRPLIFGGSVLNVCGVDYQRKGDPYLVGAEALTRQGAYNLLLSHNPDVFPVAAEKKFDLTISGHTHGGQVTLEMVHPSLNLVRFMTPYVHGHYEKGGRQIYVSRGIGTIGVPVRLGAPPEVICFRLCAT